MIFFFFWVKNSLFDSLFLVNLSVFPWDFCVFLKGIIYDSLYCEKEGLKRLSDDVGFIPNLNL